MLAFLAKPLIKWLAIGAIFAGLGITIYVLYLQKQHAQDANVLLQKDLDTAIAANVANEQALVHLQTEEALKQQVTASTIAKQQADDVASEAAKKDLRNAPGANDIVTPYLDNLGDRLRQLDSKGGN